MPATAGRVRMPANNRLSVSDSLRTSEIWQKSVGYDPYAPTGDNASSTALSSKHRAISDYQSNNALGEINEKAKGLFVLARLTGSSSSVTPGACRKCGQVGHLMYQCRNNISLSQTPQGTLGALSEEEDEDDDEEEDDEDFGEKEVKEVKAKVEVKESKGYNDSRQKETSINGEPEKRHREKHRKRHRGHHKSDKNGQSASDDEIEVKHKRKRSKHDGSQMDILDKRRRKEHKRKVRNQSSDSDSDREGKTIRKRHKRSREYTSSDGGSDSDDARNPKKRRKLRNGRRCRE